MENEAVKGYTQMNKEHLLPAICKVLGIDTHHHHQAATAHAAEKAALKTKLKELKAARAKALEAHDRTQLKAVRRHRHRVNRKLRAVTA
jgi:DNA polymerase III alpha subunit (gram-positive type)